MEDKLYPRSVFEQDLQIVRDMDITMDLKIEKGEALAHLFYHQNDEWMIDHLSIADHRENIIGVHLNDKKLS